MSTVSRVKSHDPRKAPELLPRPRFGLWDVMFFAESPTTSLSQADEVIFGHWDDYADEALRVLHRMITQTEELMFGDDEYTGLVRTFLTLTRRPNLSTVLRDTVYGDQHESILRAHDDSFLTPVQKAWHLWATGIEAIHQDLAQKMSRCRLQPAAKQDESDFGLAHLSLCSRLPRTERLTGLLHKILDSASETDEEPEKVKRSLEDDMRLMAL